MVSMEIRIGLFLAILVMDLMVTVLVVAKYIVRAQHVVMVVNVQNVLVVIMLIQMVRVKPLALMELIKTVTNVKIARPVVADVLMVQLVTPVAPDII